MIDDICEAPELAGHRLLAHLLRNGDVIGLDLAVGVVGADTDPHLAAPLGEDEFDFAAGLRAGRLDDGGGRRAGR
jgi:hypothetical protein